MWSRDLIKCLSNTLQSIMRGAVNQLVLSALSEGSGGWPHSVKNSDPTQLQSLMVRWKTKGDYSFTTCGFSSDRLTTQITHRFIHGSMSSAPFCFPALASFFITPFFTCQCQIDGQYEDTPFYIGPLFLLVVLNATFECFLLHRHGAGCLGDLNNFKINNFPESCDIML